MRVLSDEERDKIVREIHYSYKEEVKKMSRPSNEECKKIVEEMYQEYGKEVSLIKLTDEECREIAKQVHEDFEEISKSVAQDMERLNRISREKAVAKFAQEKQDKKLINDMKPSLVRWFLNLFL